MIRYYFLLLFFITCFYARAQKESGIFYSTLYAKEATYLRGNNIGNKADYVFFKDVNGDGRDDAVSYSTSNSEGRILVALSNGSSFTDQQLWETINIPEYWQLTMGDVDGDSCADLICVNKLTNQIWTLLSLGNRFADPICYTLGDLLGDDIRTLIIFDLNQDGLDDIVWGRNAGEEINWYVSYSENGTFLKTSTLGKTSDYAKFLLGDILGNNTTQLLGIGQTIDIFEITSESLDKAKSLAWDKSFDLENDCFFLADLDQDKKQDLIIWRKEHGCDWFVKYSTGVEFSTTEKWISNHLSALSKNNVTAPEYGFVGSMNSSELIAIVVSRGRWNGIEFREKGIVEDPVLLDTYEAWGADYIPEGGTYDSGDSSVHDRQIQMIHDAGFTYITLDITNGANDFVDTRAKKLMDRVRIWNQNLKEGQHKILINIALGNTRGMKTLDDFMERLNLECARAWSEFYLPYKDIYYLINNKPLVIHMLESWDFANRMDQWKGDMTCFNKLSNRWMDGTQPGTVDKPNTYGWIVPGEYGNEVHSEMMPVMPGFWNGITFWPRNEGMQYKTQWLKVLEHQPKSVWINSFNETWEHTSIEPSHFNSNQFSAHIDLKPWVDYYGNRYDHYYWDMTVQYNQLYMNNKIYVGTYLQEKGNDQLYKVVKDGFVPQEHYPVMAPVLLVPQNFRKIFNGEILEINY